MHPHEMLYTTRPHKRKLDWSLITLIASVVLQLAALFFMLISLPIYMRGDTIMAIYWVALAVICKLMAGR